MVVIQVYLISLVLILVYFRDYLGPVVLSLVLFYIFFPLTDKITKRTKIKAQWSVLIVYIAFSFLLTAVLVLFAALLVQQYVSFFVFLEKTLNNLHGIAGWIMEPHVIGPFEIALNDRFLELLLASIQSSLTTVSRGVRMLFVGMWNAFGWAFFILQVSYYLLAAKMSGENQALRLLTSRFDEDLKRLMQELGRVWGNYLRGQLNALVIMTTLYSAAFLVIGLRGAFFLALALGLSRFIPKVGLPLTWTLILTSAAFQLSGNFGIAGPWLLAAAAAILVLFQWLERRLDRQFNTKNHPFNPIIEILAVIAAARLIGVVGIVLAAPLAATLYLLARYTYFRLLDADPWAGYYGLVRVERPEVGEEPVPALAAAHAPSLILTQSLARYYERVRAAYSRWIKPPQ
jgi:predicted PurR-regulated permease PerM